MERKFGRFVIALPSLTIEIMMNPLRRYARWLHTKWPSGKVEQLPAVREDGSTNVPGLSVVGDLTGIPLLKFSADTGAKAVQRVAADSRDASGKADPDIVDLVIIGGGVSGFAAALEAKRLGLSFTLMEAAEPFSTIANFPVRKPIYTYPTDMVPAGEMRFTAQVKEPLLEELRGQADQAGVETVQARADHVRKGSGGVMEVVADKDRIFRGRHVLVAIGRSGNFRELGVEGESLDKVSNRLHDPGVFADQDVMVVGGGDSAMETAIALAESGARVTMSYRKPEFSRPKPDNIAKLEQLAAGADASLRVEMASNVASIGAKDIALRKSGGDIETLPNEAVFTMLGREAPLDFFRRSGVHVRGDWRLATWAGLIAFLAFCAFVYNWKAGGSLTNAFKERKWFPFDTFNASDPSTLWGTLSLSLSKPGFYYTLIYSTVILIFGVRRIRRRRTPYVTVQTTTLMVVQWLPLFLLPYILLPWMGHNGWFDAGFGRTFADNLFPVTDWDAHGREYWRAFGFILAWPLFIWNVFSSDPLWWWLWISLGQTFALIPILIYFFGKGAYCGWICSCGAMAETLGDAHRQKMPHGPFWNRLNMLGQVVLFVAFFLLICRLVSWAIPDTSAGQMLASWFSWGLSDGSVGGVQTNYYWIVDVLLAGILGIGLYFHFSGRTWCRFACPLAALMHIYARFSRFRILADKKKCISCNVCTTVCHQGIDVMNFANKGKPMEDPECVRCSACVQSCPTNVLEFGQIDRSTGEVLRRGKLAASRVQMAESGKNAT